MFERVFTNAPWEKKVGYCRALRAGDHVYVTGTAPVIEVKQLIDPEMLIEIEADAYLE